MVTFYADENFDGTVVKNLRTRGVDILTIQADGRAGLAPDSLVLDRSTELGRVLLTHDSDLLAEASKRQQEGQDFHGLIFVRKDDSKRGNYIEYLEIIAEVSDTEEYYSLVTYL